jgi:hypothetical protein
MRRWLGALVGTALGALGAQGCAAAPPKSAADTEIELPSGAQRLPSRLRRLTNLEVERSIGDLLGKPERVALELPPEVRQEGFTPNAAQDVPAAWAVRYSALVRALARRATEERLAELAACPNGAPCGELAVDALGPRAFRRPLSVDERKLLLSAYEEGSAEGGGARGGLELLLRALLESPHFLYLTELGEGGKPGELVTLSPYEIASTLSFTLRGAPPDRELYDAASAGELSSPERRAFHARRLLGMDETRGQFQRFVLEWLEVDGLDRTAKNAGLFPNYEQLKPRMLDETRAFVDEVMVHAGGSVSALLGAGFASVDPSMARFYGLSTYGPRAALSGSGRLGILQHASFLAAHAHEDASSPVKRGDFVLRKLMCQKVARPGEIGIEVVMPPPSNVTTTRERFGAHSTDKGCFACHETLDALGFTFESFDAMGARREKEHGHPVVTTARVELGGRELELADSVDLIQKLAQNPAVSECFARHAFRYFSAEHEPAVESSFLSIRERLPIARRDNLFEALIAYVRSDLFVEREVRSK